MSTLSYAPENSSISAVGVSRPTVKRVAFALALSLAVAGAGDLGYRYFTVGRHLESTDDVYVKADSTIIAPKVSGYIAEVLVSDNEPVKAGQVLDRRPRFHDRAEPG